MVLSVLGWVEGVPVVERLLFMGGHVVELCPILSTYPRVFLSSADMTLMSAWILLVTEWDGPTLSGCPRVFLSSADISLMSV